MKIDQVSPNSLLITFSDEIKKENLFLIKNAYNKIESLNDTAIIDIVPSYTTIFITFDMVSSQFSDLKNKLLKLLETKNIDNSLIEEELLTIDVYYGKEVGFDLEHIATQKGISIDAIIEIHSSKIYDLYAIGFLPGFGFLGQVDNKIAIPRLQTPRKKVPKGSVAIADTQTAIYPSDSAGGWNIIGRTTQELFFPNNLPKEISPLSIGKRIQFNPISKEEYLNQGGSLEF